VESEKETENNISVLLYYPKLAEAPALTVRSLRLRASSPPLRLHVARVGILASLDKGMLQVSDANGCRFEKEGTVVAVGVRNNKLCEMRFKMIKKTEGDPEVNLAAKENIKIWHERLEHQNISYVKQFLKAYRYK